MQHSKLKSGLKNGIEVTLNCLSNGTSDSNNETNFPHKLLLTDTQALRLPQVFITSSSVIIKLSKTELSKMIQLRGCFTLFHKRMGSACGFTSEAQKSFNNDKDKSVLKTISDAASSFINDKRFT